MINITKHTSHHTKRYNVLSSILLDEKPAVEAILDQIAAFQVAIPSWALGTGGTRFGRFAGGGPRSLEEKIRDVALPHTINQSSGAIFLNIVHPLLVQVRLQVRAALNQVSFYREMKLRECRIRQRRAELLLQVCNRQRQIYTCHCRFEPTDALPVLPD